jgi:ferritin-like metal-binding protein YciE
MAELQEREAKLIQYLNEAYGKEKELEAGLQAHIKMTTRNSYKKRLRDHLKETKAQATGLKGRIRELGGKAEVAPAPGPDVVGEAASAVTSIASKAVSAAKGPLHAVRGTSEPEQMLKNAKTEFSDEAEEIANYNAIEALAEALGDKDTAKLARGYRREEERMSKFLEKTIPQLTKEVVKAEIPAGQRKGARSKRGAGARSGSRAGTSRRSSPSATKATSRGSASKAASKPRSSGAAKSSRSAAAKTSRSAAAKTSRSSAAKTTRSAASKSSRSTGSRSRSK